MQIYNLLKRDIKNILSGGLEVFNLLMFFIITCFIFGFATSGNVSLQLASAILIVCFMLSSNLSSYNIFGKEIESGMLQQLYLKTKSTNLIISKILSQFICFALPLCAAIPFVAMLFKVSLENIFVLCYLILISSLIISALNVMIAGITIGIKNGSIISIILSIPLYIPLLIINLSYIESVALNNSDITLTSYIINIMGLALIILPLAIFSGRITIRNAVDM